jgi:uncharacterized protein YndB with AHSA1/START domain
VSTLAHTVECSILLDADPEELREALADPEFRREWLGTEVELDEEAGSPEAGSPDGSEQSPDGSERFSFRWHRAGSGESRVDLIVDAVAGGARVTVIETSLEPGASPLLAVAWRAPLAALGQSLAMRPVLA